MPDVQLAHLPPQARILCLRLSALGDIVFALPVLDALRQALPQAQIDWLVEDRHASVLQAHPSLQQVLQFPRRQWTQSGGLGRLHKHFRQLRKQGTYDLILDFQSNLKSALQLCFLSSKTKVGFAKPIAREGAHRFHHIHAEVPARCHRSRRDLQLLQRLGWEGNPNFHGHWPLPPAIPPQLELPSSNFLLFHTTTAQYGQDKQWPPARWAELAQALYDHGKQVLLLWTPADRTKVEQVLQLAKGCAQLAPATPSLTHLMQLSDAADTLFGTDSGPVHLAAYRGTPVVALFGPTDAVVYRPPGEKVCVVTPLALDTPPPPRDRSQASPLMEQIPVEAVVEAFLQQRSVSECAN